MNGEVALVKEQGQTFAVLAVKPHAVRDPGSVRRYCGPDFSGSGSAPRCWPRMAARGGRRTSSTGCAMSTRGSCRGATSRCNGVRFCACRGQERLIR